MILNISIEKFCKDLLRKYPLLCAEIETLERERQTVADTETKDQAFRLMRLEEHWHGAAFYKKSVGDLLETLNEEKRLIVKLRYFKNEPIWKVANELGVSEATVHRYQKDVLASLAHRLGL